MPSRRALREPPGELPLFIVLKDEYINFVEAPKYFAREDVDVQT